jgi:2-C-methyl-D-erythritol 4-phosphate cytidylyltransferase
MSVAALVLAAGRGERLGSAVPKAFVPLAGRPLLVHAVESLCAAGIIETLVPVVAPGELARIDALAAELAAYSGVAPAVVGGAERQDSMRAGMAALGPEVEWVAVHDAARPLVRPADVRRVVEAAQRDGAAILAVPVRDTIKRVRGSRIVETPPRLECYAAQTPQVFRVALLREAMEKACADGFVGTDDAELVERMGVRVSVVEGDRSNFKVTDASDLAEAERWLAGSGA